MPGPCVGKIVGANSGAGQSFQYANSDLENASFMLVDQFVRIQTKLVSTGGASNAGAPRLGSRLLLVASSARSCRSGIVSVPSHSPSQR